MTENKLTVIALDDLSVKSEDPNIDPAMLLAYAEASQLIMRAHYMEIGQMVADCLIYGAGVFKISSDGIRTRITPDEFLNGPRHSSD